MDGVLVVNKPAGPTSHDVVAQVRQSLQIKRVGHTGTLDPMATGVLPLVLGRATRLAQFFSGDSKTYTATIRLGFSTDTYDALGTPISPTASASSRPANELGARAIDLALEAFRGTFDQQPPPFSAKKIAGTRAYTLARRGRPVAPSPVPVTVDRLTLLDVADGRLKIEVPCSAGFYVRSLAHDIGQALSCGAHLEALRRTRSGEFDLTQAVTLDHDVVRASVVDQWIIPLSQLLGDVPAVIVTSQGRLCASHGQLVSRADLTHTDDGTASTAIWVRLIDETGQLVAIAEPRDGALHPRVVLV